MALDVRISDRTTGDFSEFAISQGDAELIAAVVARLGCPGSTSLAEGLERLL